MLRFLLTAVISEFEGKPDLVADILICRFVR